MNDPVIYQIRVKGHLSAQWADWFYGMVLCPIENGETLISGLLADQAALHGILGRVRDLGLTLIALERLECPLAERWGDEGAHVRI